MTSEGLGMECRNCAGRGIWCEDCGVSLCLVRDGFMVVRQLWDRYGVDACHNWEGKPWPDIIGNRRGYLCLSCFQQRLGRFITISDLVDCRLNEALIDRLRSIGLPGEPYIPHPRTLEITQ